MKVIKPIAVGTIYLLAFYFLAGCSSNEKSLLPLSEAVVSDVSGDDLSARTTNNLYDQAHSTKNAVDWDGVYIGTIPCASCPGIKMILTVSEGGYYRLEETYLGEKDGIFRSEGLFDWDDSGSRITFRGEDKRTWMVGENRVWLVDANGKPSSNYMLKKQREQIEAELPLVRTPYRDASELKVGDTIILDGLYTWGHEVVSFEPCASNYQYWATGKTAITKPLNEASFNKAIVRKIPYQPIFIRAKIKVLPPAQEGFAESYDGLIEILDVKKLLTDKDCSSK